MAAGLLRFLSFLAFFVMARPPMRLWRRLKYLPFVPWPSALNIVSRVPSQSIFPFLWPHESLAVRQGQTFTGGLVWHWMESKTAVRVASHFVARWMARRCLCVSRRRRNRPSNACPLRKAHRHYSPRPIAPSVSPCRRTHHSTGLPSAAREFKRWETVRDAWN